MGGPVGFSVIFFSPAACCLLVSILVISLWSYLHMSHLSMVLWWHYITAISLASRPVPGVNITIVSHVVHGSQRCSAGDRLGATSRIIS